jgi:hypothetical protein
MAGIIAPLIGAATGNCGPSQAEKDQQAQSASFAAQLKSNYGTRFGQQSDVLNAINQSLSPILAAGPSQQGFSAAETAALNTQAINSAGAASKNAQQAAANFGAGQGGGGSSGITSGIQQQIQGSIASQSANQLAGAQNQITQANYAQGNQNYWKAQGGMNALSQGYSPNAAMEGATNEQKQAFGEAGTVYQQQQQEDQAIAGGISSLAMTAAGGIGGGISGVANSAAGASQPAAFAQGFFNGIQ